MKHLIIFGAVLLLFLNEVYADNRWAIRLDGSIVWHPQTSESHRDHIEMSGFNVSSVLRYGVDRSGRFELERSIIWPTLRMQPNHTRDHLNRRFALDVPGTVLVNGHPLRDEQVKEVVLDGTLRAESHYQASGGAVKLCRTIYSSPTAPALCELYVLQNAGKQAFTVEIPTLHREYNTEKTKGVYGSYRILVEVGGNTRILQPGDSLLFSARFSAYKPGEKEQPFAVGEGLTARRDLVRSLRDKLILETPDTIINTMFAFAKLRAAESIFMSKNGLLHSPCGEAYYTGIWANDQAEYMNPLFPFMGYAPGIESSMNAYGLFASYTNPEYKRLPSSFISEGTKPLSVAGDRGDAAMVAYGASRFALASGDVELARKLWDLIEWTLEYCRRQLNDEGVVLSDSDELENRFPAGKANLCTSSLYYDALLSASYLARELKIPNDYERQAQRLRTNIIRYFGATVEGFETYQYYKGNDILRSWICIPLTVGINERSTGTIDALFSPRLWSEEGLLTQAGTKVYWDRSTLYALRGVFMAGQTERAAEYLRYYSAKRLLGDHVPYAIEAWPEGNQRHLSAESGLYCRILTEGVFGIRPTGLRSFTVTPRLPKSWPGMALRRIQAFGNEWDVEVVRKGKKLHIRILCGGRVVVDRSVREGGSISV